MGDNFLMEFMEAVFAPPPIGTVRHFMWSGRWYRTIMGKGIVAIRDEEDGEYRDLNESEWGVVDSVFPQT